MPRYLVKGNEHRSRGRNSVQLAEKLGVGFPFKLKKVGMLGNFSAVKTDGRIRSQLSITVREGVDGFAHDASKRRYRADYVPAKSNDLKRVVRLLRDQEAEGIDLALRSISKKRMELDAAEQVLDDLLRKAFSKGNVVPVSELVEMAKAHDGGQG